jgi:HEPN domain-containing protein
MENHSVNLTSTQHRELDKIINSLIQNYDPQYLICFGSIEQAYLMTNCFAGANEKRSVRYYLLMITGAKACIEHRVQEFLNNSFAELPVCVLVHDIDAVKLAIRKGSRFFNHVVQHGAQLYSKNGLRLNIDGQSFAANAATTYFKAHGQYGKRFPLAKGFLETAAHSLRQGYYTNGVFLLHQAVEQACNVLILIYLAYRTDVHNIGRLLDLCLLFSDELSEAIPRRTADDKRLFAMLRNSYGEARYKDDFQANEADAAALLARVTELVDVAERLATAKLTEYAEKATAEQASFVTYPTINNPLPYAD